MIIEGKPGVAAPDLVIAGVIEIYDNVYPNVDEVLRFIQRHAAWEPALIGDEGPGVRIESKRSNEITWFDPMGYLTPEILRQFAKTTWQYLDDYAQRYHFMFSGIEPVNVNRYLPGEFYKPHADSGKELPRVVSALVYLNDVENGGQTEFVHHNVSVQPKAGRLVIFPSNYAYAHAAHPPVDGVKYSAAFWATGN